MTVKEFPSTFDKHILPMQQSLSNKNAIDAAILLYHACSQINQMAFHSKFTRYGLWLKYIIPLIPLIQQFFVLQISIGYCSNLRFYVVLET